MDVVVTIGRLHAQLGQCYYENRVSGVAQVLITVNADGSVRSAVTRGEFAGQPTGICIANAIVQNARFPATDKESTFNYPIVLR